MSVISNMVSVLSATTGSAGPIVLGAAVSVNFVTEVQAGAVDQRPVSLHVQEGADWMLIKGIYTASGRSVAISKVLMSMIAGTFGTTPMTLAGAEVVTFVSLGEDFQEFRDIREITGTSDALINSDGGGVVTYNNAAAVAVSIANVTGLNFKKGWYVWIKNKGAGTVTITPTTATIDSGVIKANQAMLLYSDGTNYKTMLFRNDLGTAAVRADTDFPRTDVAQSLTTAQQAQARTNTSAFGVIRVQKFTSSGTYTPDPHLIFAILKSVGGGGGGGGATGAANNYFGGGGGGSGSTSETYATAATIGVSQAVNIGTGGAGGAGSNNGASGTDTSVGSLCIGKGGSGGKFSANAVQCGAGGLGGIAGTGDVTGTGAPGGGGIFNGAGGTNVQLCSGAGGSSLFGGGGVPVTGAGANNGTAGTGPGGGGSGAYVGSVASNATGGAGISGEVVVVEFCSQ